MIMILRLFFFLLFLAMEANFIQFGPDQLLETPNHHLRLHFQQLLNSAKTDSVLAEFKSCCQLTNAEHILVLISPNFMKVGVGWGGGGLRIGSGLFQ
jgi:hypothetical protein